MSYPSENGLGGIRSLVERAGAGVRSWRFWLGFGISAVCLVLVFRGVNVQELISALRAADYVWLAPAAGLFVVSMVVRTVRWQGLFFPQTGLHFATLFHVLNISYLINNIVPARAGDLVRAGLVSTRQPVSASRALATVVVERVLDSLTLVVVLAFLLPLFPVPEWIARVGQVAGASMAAVGVGLVVLSTQRARTVRWSHAVLGRVPRIDGLRWAERVGGLVDGLGALRSPAALGQAGAWSVVVWLLSGAAYYFVMQAFHLNLPVTAGMFVLAVTALVSIVPATPGYVGVFDYTAVLALAVFGVERSLALSCAIVLHAVSFITFSGMGLISLARESLSFSAVIGEQSPVIGEQSPVISEQ
ncbi:MAG: lysylphosphatidylglycerol synthase transmembrane domain-containing protein [Anaerolineae bacterium]